MGKKCPHCGKPTVSDVTASIGGGEKIVTDRLCSNCKRSV